MAHKDIKHLNTKKEYIIRAVVTYGARKIHEIDSIRERISPQYWKDSTILLGELIQEGDVSLENEFYKVRPALEADYEYYEENMHAMRARINKNQTPKLSAWWGFRVKMGILSFLVLFVQLHESVRQ